MHQLPLRERLELFLPVCQAVQHAHQKGIIHRDLKPTNVLIAEYDGRPVPKVIDFGVAKATAQRLTERTMFTEFGQVIGTVEYMSPEQAAFNQLDIDTRSDIYSLGVLLYEILTGSTPFERDHLREAAFDEVLRIIREEEPPKPSTRLSTSDMLPSIAANRHTEPARLSKTVRGDLDWIVMKCLEKDRSRRYDTATGLSRDIHRYMRNEAVQARPPSAAYRLKKFFRRNKAGVFAGSALVAALIGGLILASIGFVQARRQALIATAEAAKATAISDLLQSSLHSANPEQDEGVSYCVRELLQDIFHASDPDDKAGAATGHSLRTLALELPLTGGYAALKEKAFRDAALVFGKLAAHHPDDPTNWHFLAHTYVFLGNFYVQIAKPDEAEQAFRRAVELYNEHAKQFDANPVNDVERASAYLWLAWFLISADRTTTREEVADLFRKAAHIMGDEGGSQLWWFATAASARGNPQKQLALAELAVGAAPDTWQYQTYLGAAQYRAGEFERSINSLNRSTELRHGGGVLDWYFLAMAYWKLDHKENARQWFDRAVKQQHENGSEHVVLRRFRAEAAELLGITRPQPSSDTSDKP